MKAFASKAAAAAVAAALSLTSVPLDAWSQTAAPLPGPVEALPALPVTPESAAPEAAPAGLAAVPTEPLPSLDVPLSQAALDRPVERSLAAVERSLSAGPQDRPKDAESESENARRLFDLGAAVPGQPAEGAAITRHDGHRIQIKHDIALVPGKKNVYRIGAYFFVPHALGITPATYKKTDFYGHLQRRLRFKTPATTLTEILDRKNPNSPFSRFEATLDFILAGDESPQLESAAYTEIRLLGKIASVALRDASAALARSAAAKKPDLDALRSGTVRLVEDSARLMAEVRILKATAASAPPKVRETVAFLDEFLSLSVAEHAMALLAALRRAPAVDAALPQEDAKLAGLIRAEDEARAKAGYPSVVDKATGSEAMFYRRSVLTNFFSSVLELENRTSGWGGVYQGLFAFSAGVSAIAAFFLLREANGHWASHVTLLLVGYMMSEILKDRLKAYFNDWTTRRWTKRFADAVTAIRDPSTGKVVGKVRESFGFLPRGDVPKEILSIRQADPLAAVGEDGKPEDVLHYSREVTIDARAIDRHHTRRRNLDDVMLMNLVPFLANTDDAKTEFTTLDPETGKLETLTGTRVYHVNVVTRYDGGAEAEPASARYERRRIVLDRQGIERVEAVPVPSSASGDTRR